MVNLCLMRPSKEVIVVHRESEQCRDVMKKSLSLPPEINTQPNKMKFKLIFLTVAFMMATHVFGQNPDNEADKLYRQVYKSKVPIWLNLNAGLNVSNCYDNGTVPFSYRGLGANLRLGATIEWRRCHVQTESMLLYGAFGNLNGTAIDIDSRTEFLYRFHDSRRNRWHFWAGGAVQSFYDIKSLSALMNASTGVTMFFNLCAEGMVQYDFAFIRNHSHNLLTVYGKLSLPLGGMVVRPGYAYMDNYTQDINMINTLLQDYESFGKFFPGVSTDVGLYFNLLNGNRIGLNYRWDYLTTRHKGIYRYDNAIHSVYLSFMFNIN